MSGIKEALGIKAHFKQPSHLQQAFTYGKNLGSQAHVFAQDCLEVDADVTVAYGLHPDLGLYGQEGPASATAVGLPQHDGLRNAARLESMEPGTPSQPGTSSKAVMPLSMDVEAPEEGEKVEDMVAEARRQMRHVGEQPGVARAVSRLEDFQKSDDGEFSLAPNLRREVHRVHRNLGILAMRFLCVLCKMLVFEITSLNGPRSISDAPPAMQDPGQNLPDLVICCVRLSSTQWLASTCAFWISKVIR